jgi:hypothetical protein
MTITAARPSAVDHEDSHVLFREARQRRRRRIATTVGILLATIGLVVGLIASFGGAPPRRPRTTRPRQPNSPSAGIAGHVVLRGNGLGVAQFGQSELLTIDELNSALGTPLHDAPTNMTGNCTIDAGMQWTTLTAYFFHGRFVGYGTNSIRGYFLKSDARTVAGLKLGDSLTEAEVLYGGTLHTSTAQGGSWSVATATGNLAGLFTAEVDQTPSQHPRIADITAGSVGCPAASP